MRVAVIGAGFFGFHSAEQLRRRFPEVEIDMFEKESAPLLGAGTTNQCRLHMGFHYPRSGYTIYQSIMGFDRFCADYGEYLHDVGDNVYAIHRDGLVTVEQYLAVMDAFHLSYQEVPVSAALFRQPEDIALAIRVLEKSIDVRRIREHLSTRFTGTLHLATPVDEVDAAAGMVRSGTREFGPYDFVVNASYTNPNLGLPQEQQFAVKWELAAMVLARTSLPPASAVTVMDGPYVSVYPAYDGLHTLSSVPSTPMRHYGALEDLAADYPHRFALADDEAVRAKIEQDVREHLRIEHEVKELWVTAKTKLSTDMGDSRVTEVRRHGRLLSVLCGKIDAVFEASDSILREIR